jgi:hypothetical protein
MVWRRIRPYRRREGAQDDEPTKKDDPARESKAGSPLSKTDLSRLEGPHPSTHDPDVHASSADTPSEHTR